MIGKNSVAMLLFASALAVGAGSPGTAASAGAGSSYSAGAGTVATSGASSSGQVVQLGYQMAAQQPYGWTGQQAACLNYVWTRESGWSATAANPTSDARGIAQKITGWSADYQPGNATQQIAWGLAYIKGRYGTPCAAWAHEQAVGWY